MIADAPLTRSRTLRLARVPAVVWAAAAAVAGLLPFVRGLSASNIFYTRDLSLYFWGRYLWFRRELALGHWPLWDPYLGGGQAAVADGLHQMFFPPAFVTRLLPSEVLGFNLWVALPFPAAALGAWLFFRRRFSACAATVGAIAFAASGVVVSTGNFPNMSWSVAALPWVLWAVDRLMVQPAPRTAAVLATTVALQALAGEPVSEFATLALASCYAVFTADKCSWRERARQIVWVEAVLVLGLLVAAIQLVPMAQAAATSQRTQLAYRDFWSLRPLALVETLSLHFFGDYFGSQSLDAVPWMQALNTGREPFFFSIYVGVPLLALTTVGLVSSASRAWGRFWVVAGLVGLLGAFGGYTPVYPFLRDHLPVLDSFRFPVKYLVVSVMAVAAGAAAGWDALAPTEMPAARFADPAKWSAVALALLIALVAGAAVAGCVYFTTPMAFRFYEIARSVGVRDPVPAAEFMLRQLPGKASMVLLLSVASALLMYVGASRRPDAPLARGALFACIAVDLLVHAWGVNPVFDAAYVAQPAWMSFIPADADDRFYVGGKRDGTLDATDLDASRAFLNPPGLAGSASRAALSNQAAFYPSAWRRREILSYDLAVLWPLDVTDTIDRFFEDSGREERDRFLDRTGVRYRILPPWQAGDRQPLMKVPYFLDSLLYDWGGVTPRVQVVANARVVADVDSQIDQLFADGWDSRRTALMSTDPEMVGAPGPPVEPFARVIADTPNRVAIEAGAGAAGGYLVLLDSYSADWRARVDGQDADVERADGLFRALHLAPGRHDVEFVFRPRAFYLGAFVSGVSLLAVLVLAFRRQHTVVS